MNELDQLKKNAGISESLATNTEVMVQDFGGLPLARVIEMIKQDAEKLDPNMIDKADLLFIRNGATAIVRAFDRSRNLMDSEE